LHPLRDLFSQSTIYSIGNVAIKIVGLFLIPLCLNPEYLTVDEFNFWGIIVPASQVLVILIGLGLNQSVIRYYGDSINIANQKSLLSTIFMVTLIISLLSTIVGIVISYHIFSEKLFWIILAVLIYVAVETILRVPVDLLRAQERPAAYAIINSLKIFVTFVLTIYFLVSARMGIWALLWGQLIGSTVILIYLLVLQSRFLFDRFSWSWFEKAIGYGGPLIWASLSSVLLNMGDRFLIEYFMGENAIGPVAVYTLAVQIAGVLNMFLVQSFNSVFIIIAIRNLKNSAQSAYFFRSTFRIYGLLLLILGMGLSIIAPEGIELLIRYFNSDPIYKNAAWLVSLITFGYVFLGMTIVVVIGLHILKRSGLISVTIIIAMFFNLIINCFLIPLYGLWGAAAATILAYALLFMLTLYLAEHLYPVGYPVFFFIKWFAGISILVVLLLVWPAGSVLFRLISKIAIMLALILLLAIIYRKEIRNLIQRTQLSIWNSTVSNEK
jgi:O-antigen/teichoic acid export membrane protein